jgi:hypothetical protein
MGANFERENKPCGCTDELTLACFQFRQGCQLNTGVVKKRGCRISQAAAQCLVCEQVEGSDARPGELLITSLASTGQLLCCCDNGVLTKISCCPQPLNLCSGQGQILCLYYRCAIPCNDLTPCELGLGGVLCVDRHAGIIGAETRFYEARELNSKRHDILEAVIVRGAPCETMER